MNSKENHRCSERRLFYKESFVSWKLSCDTTITQECGLWSTNLTAACILRSDSVWFPPCYFGSTRSDLVKSFAQRNVFDPVLRILWRILPAVRRGAQLTVISKVKEHFCVACCAFYILDNGGKHSFSLLYRLRFWNAFYRYLKAIWVFLQSFSLS